MSQPRFWDATLWLKIPLMFMKMDRIVWTLKQNRTTWEILASVYLILWVVCCCCCCCFFNVNDYPDAVYGKIYWIFSTQALPSSLLCEWMPVPLYLWSSGNCEFRFRSGVSLPTSTVCGCVCVTAGGGREDESTHTPLQTCQGIEGSGCYSWQPFMSSFLVNLNFFSCILKSDYHGNY